MIWMWKMKNDGSRVAGARDTAYEVFGWSLNEAYESACVGHVVLGIGSDSALHQAIAYAYGLLGIHQFLLFSATALHHAAESSHTSFGRRAGTADFDIPLHVALLETDAVGKIAFGNKSTSVDVIVVTQIELVRAQGEAVESDSPKFLHIEQACIAVIAIIHRALLIVENLVSMPLDINKSIVIESHGIERPAAKVDVLHEVNLLLLLVAYLLALCRNACHILPVVNGTVIKMFILSIALGAESARYSFLSVHLLNSLVNLPKFSTWPRSKFTNEPSLFLSLETLY